VHRPQFRLGLLRRDTVAQAPDGLITEAGPGIDRVAGLEVDGNPELRIEVGEMRLRRRYADNLAVHAIEKYGAADDRSIRAKLLPPESVAEHHDAVLARTLLCRREEAAQRRAHPKRLKQVGADGAAKGALGKPGAGNVEFAFERVARDAGQCVRAPLILPDPPLGIV